ncbi:dolichyl-phosphate mannosyltransferase polypeptide 3 [Polychaeton citri CBS 116435]|uniref:Dolichol-phosphate mannosyltransferase subunit 3 n=1 Tax=Polychaeton citri CBS 116435 TaxID=1314669 RepID=A0A9P4QE54_9PEZI|nr:dolichyl-phosphate mannosyltransferase polypeptide 3 [Polychaeton citri CBS 116435]
MTRATQQLSAAIAAVAIYLSCFLGMVPLPSTISGEIIPVLPFWIIISLGAFLLFKLGYGVLTFNDVPEAHAELMQQIDVAKKELRTKGVQVD